MADVNVLDLTNATPGSGDSLILFDRNTGEAKATQYNTLQSTVLGSKFGDSSPANGDELTYNLSSGKWKNTKRIGTLETNLNKVSSDVTAVNSKADGIIDGIKANGAVNMLPNEVTTQVINGITFTVNDDGTITANGTANGTATLSVCTDTRGLAGDNLVKVSGCPAGASGTGGSATYCYQFRDSTGTLRYATDEGWIGKLPSSDYGSVTAFNIRILNGTTVNNLVFKPMITVASYDGDYVPYVKSNKELTEDVNNLFDRFGQHFKVIHLGSIKSSSKTITVNTTIAGLLATYHSGNPEAYDSLHMVNCTPTEVPAVKTIASASSINLGLTENGKITVTNTGGGSSYVYLLLFKGEVTIS